MRLGNTQINLVFRSPCATFVGMIRKYQFSVSELLPYIDWGYFFHAWQVKGDSKQGAELKMEAIRMLELLDDSIGAEALYRSVKVHSENEDIVIDETEVDATELHHRQLIPLLRQQSLGANGITLCLADFVNPKGDTIGLFATTCALMAQKGADPYESLMMQTLATRLAEAAAEKVDEETLMILKTDKGIRPAVGYPSLPDLSINFLLDEMINMKSIGITLTENGAMNPPSSVSGLIIRHPAAHYFSIGRISEEQFKDYTRRRGLPPERMRQFLHAVLD